MAEPSLQLGNGNWAGKSGNLLAYHKANNNFYADELTFSRASSGTIVNADGLIEEVPYNLVTYSEQFDNAGWSKSSSTVTSNAATSPNGDLTADKLNIGSNGSLYQSGVSVVPNTEYTFSFYIQDIDSANNKLAIYDESNASFIAIDVAYSVTSEWTRVTYSFTTPTGCASARPYIQRASTLGSGSVYIWGAQLNSGSTAKTYYPTTTRLNVPRVDYLNNSNGSLLLEPQRTNLVTYSEDFSQSYWSKSSITVTDGFTSPSGDLTASKFTEGSTNINHQIYTAISGTAGSIYTISGFFKKGERDVVQLLFGGATFDEGNTYCNFDLENGVLGSGTYLDASITFISNGWYKCSFTATKTTTGNFNSTYCPKLTATSTRAAAYLGDGTSGIYAYGAQVELGSYPTSYIPTSGTTATRLADTSATTGLSDVIGQTEGTYFVEIKLDSNLGNQTILDISDDSSSDRLGLILSSSVLTAFRLSPTDTTTAISTSTADADTTYKCAFAYSSGRHSFYVNGVQIGSDTNTITALNLFKINLGSRYNGGEVISGNVQNLQIFKTALTNTELATLTTI